MGKPWQVTLANAQRRRKNILDTFDSTEKKHGVTLPRQEVRQGLLDLDVLEFQIKEADKAGDPEKAKFLADRHTSLVADFITVFAPGYIKGPLAAGATAWRWNPPDHARWCELAREWLKDHPGDRGRGYPSRLCKHVAEQVERTSRQVWNVLKDRGIM